MFKVSPLSQYYLFGKLKQRYGELLSEISDGAAKMVERERQEIHHRPCCVTKKA
jgi:hypothetical protein